MPLTKSKRECVVIAGASGFIGQSLIDVLSQTYDVVCLTHLEAPIHNIAPQKEHTDWWYCNLFSLQQVENVLKHADYAIYLVHSMLPKSRTILGNFGDIDFMLADNFSRAAEKCKIKKIIYMSGFVPSTQKMSKHIESRYEVEKVLSGRSTVVITLRSGIVLGANGSSFQMLYTLVLNSPIILFTKLTDTLIQPISLNVLVKLFSYCLSDAEKTTQSYDVGGKEVFTYKEMFKQMAIFYKTKHIYLSIPFLHLMQVFKFFLPLITGFPKQLTSPLVESMRYNMIVQDNSLHVRSGIFGEYFSESLQIIKESISNNVKINRNKSVFKHYFLRKKAAEKKVDLSICRVATPQGMSAKRLVYTYVIWLGSIFKFLINAKVTGKGIVGLYIGFFDILLLELTFAEENKDLDRQYLYITGGLLLSKSAGQIGVLEFRRIGNSNLFTISIHDFLPALPWWMYHLTQAPLHSLVMWLFDRYLAKRISQFHTGKKRLQK